MGYEGFNATAERDQNTVGREIARARGKCGLSQPALCKLLRDYGVSVQPAAVSKWEKGENIPHAYQLLALCHALGISSVLDFFRLEPMLNSEGLERLEHYRTDLIASGRYRPRQAEPDTIRYIDMPVSLLPVSAGTGEFLGEDSFERISFPENSIPKGAELGIRVSGDSMEPVYHDGQIVWMRRCETLRSGEVGIFLYDGSGYLKVYNDKGDQPVLISYNRSYDPIPVLPERVFRIAGRVLN